MKIKINEQIVAEVKITQRQVCPAGTAYWGIDYQIDGITVHSATTGAIWGEPDPIAMLDRVFERRINLAMGEDGPEGYRKGGCGTVYRGCNDKGHEEQTWILELTHRQAIIEAVAQIVVE